MIVAINNGFVSEMFGFLAENPWGTERRPRRSFGISSSLKIRHPTMLVNHFHICFQNKTRIMEIKLFGHPLNPRDLGTAPVEKSATIFIQDSLNESSARPNGTPVMPILLSWKTQKFLKFLFF